MEAFRAEIKLLYLREQQLERRWAHEDAGEGVMLRTSKDHYICQPRDLPDRNGSFYEAMKKLNAKVRQLCRLPTHSLPASMSNLGKSALTIRGIGGHDSQNPRHPAVPGNVQAAPHALPSRTANQYH